VNKWLNEKISIKWSDPIMQFSIYVLADVKHIVSFIRTSKVLKQR
jgi:hypothetical protein